MSVFEAGMESGRRAGTSKFAALTDSSPRIGRGAEFADRSWAPPPHEATLLRSAGRTAGAFLRLLIPILLLATLGGASFVNAGTPAPVFAQHWLNMGLLLLPLTFLAVHLTGRRYGAGYAFAQVFLTYAAGVALAVFARDTLTMILGQQQLALRVVIGFAAGLFAAHMVAIFLFDRLRGPRWWQAPLFASLFGGIVLSGVAFPASYFGTPTDWAGQMLDYMAVTSAAAILLVIPYWMLRGLVPPRSGFGGY